MLERCWLPALSVKAKQQGKEVTATSRLDQADFSAAIVGTATTVV
ncbi:MAG: hypothetical protein E7L15_02385 [Citrobacter portucalensis]|nr:hypothetical protein [Citrobacter portucalensis]MDU7402717.1 hypothetical protein [Citrobacter portucalensis]